MDGGLIAGVEAKAFGAKLYKAVFASDEGKEILGRLYEGSDWVRLRVSFPDGKLAAIPWELLYDPSSDRYLARRGSVVRWPQFKHVIEKPREISPDGQIRTLIVAASPNDLEQLELAEVDRLGKVFERAGVAKPEIIRNATRESLQRCLAEALEKGEPFQIVHFACHAKQVAGKPDPYLVLERSPEMVEAEDGAPGEQNTDHLIGPTDLAGYLSDHDVRLVFLNACASDGILQTSSGHVTPRFARSLIATGVPSVITMKTGVEDPFAAELARRFYGALLQGRPIDRALTDARTSVEVQANRTANFGIPVLYLAPGSGDARLVEPSRAPARRAQRIAIAAAAATVLIVAGLALFTDAFRSGPRPMGGDINIAVAEFELLSGDDDTQLEALSLADSIHDRLSQRLECGDATRDGVLFQCRSPEDIGVVAGRDSALRAEAAADLADRLRADIVIYGTVSEDSGQVVFTPSVFLADRQLTGAEDLIGPHELSAESGSFELANQRRDFRNAVDLRTENLTDLVFALADYATGEHEAAASQIQVLVDGDSWSTDRHLLYLLLGNLRGRLDDPAAAEAAYLASLAASPGYGRALVGVAEVAYQKAIGTSGCNEEDVTADDLDTARAAYGTAAAAPIQPPLAHVAHRATFGLARINLCATQIGFIDGWDEARQQFADVAAEYEEGGGALIELAAESYSSMAWIDLSTAPTIDAQRELAPAAISNLERARELSRLAERDAQYLLIESFAYKTLEDYDVACERLDQARGLATQASSRIMQLAQTEVAVSAQRLGCSA